MVSCNILTDSSKNSEDFVEHFPKKYLQKNTTKDNSTDIFKNRKIFNFQTMFSTTKIFLFIKNLFGLNILI